MAARMSLAALIRADWRANRDNRKSRLILPAFRLLHPLAVHPGAAVRALSLPLRLAYQVLVEWFLCVEVPLRAFRAASVPGFSTRMVRPCS